jgi:hypothetical protein
VECVYSCSPYKITATSSFFFFDFVFFLYKMFSLSMRDASKSHQVSQCYECKVAGSKFFSNAHSFVM